MTTSSFKTNPEADWPEQLVMVPSGVVRDPLVGYQAGGAAGAALGVVIGSTGLVLKPTSGLLEFISKAVNGIGMGILAWGDEVVRIPRTRIRSPRHFGMFAIDPTGALPACLTLLLLHSAVIFPATSQTGAINQRMSMSQ